MHILNETKWQIKPLPCGPVLTSCIYEVNEQIFIWRIKRDSLGKEQQIPLTQRLPGSQGNCRPHFRPITLPSGHVSFVSFVNSGFLQHTPLIHEYPYGHLLPRLQYGPCSVPVGHLRVAGQHTPTSPWKYTPPICNALFFTKHSNPGPQLLYLALAWHLTFEYPPVGHSCGMNSCSNHR